MIAVPPNRVGLGPVSSCEATETDTLGQVFARVCRFRAPDRHKPTQSPAERPQGAAFPQRSTRIRRGRGSHRMQAATRHHPSGARLTAPTPPKLQNTHWNPCKTCIEPLQDTHRKAAQPASRRRPGARIGFAQATARPERPTPADSSVRVQHCGTSRGSAGRLGRSHARSCRASRVRHGTPRSAPHCHE